MKKIVMTVILCLGIAYLFLAIIANDPKYILGVLGIYKFSYIDPVIELTAEVCFWQLPILVVLYFVAKSLKKKGANLSRIIGWSILGASFVFFVLALFSNISNYLAETIAAVLFIIAAIIILLIDKNKSKKAQNIKVTAIESTPMIVAENKNAQTLEQKKNTLETKIEMEEQLTAPPEFTLNTLNGPKDQKNSIDTKLAHFSTQRKVYTQDILQRILDLHKKYILHEDGGSPAVLLDADLHNADLECAFLNQAFLFNANLSGANLSGASLEQVGLRGADLSNANLMGANLRNAQLDGADLRNADFRAADLYDATLDGAMLRGANLRGALLHSTFLVYADLAGALLDGAFYDKTTLWPYDFDPKSTGAILKEE